MKCLKKITDEDLDLEAIPLNNPKHRLGARGIILNDKSKIAILYNNSTQEYKLVGCNIVDDEDPIKMFKRETLEKIGCVIEIDDCLGIIEELKSQDNLKQTSYIYVAHVVEETKSLIENKDYSLIWLDIEEAMKKFKNNESKLIDSKYEDDINVYHKRFTIIKDYTILKYYKKNLYFFN